MKYCYDDEDNAPMNDDAMPGVRMDWKRYSDIIAEMNHTATVQTAIVEYQRSLEEHPLPFTDPPLPEKGCWNCMEYNGYACTIRWNNLDESYYDPDLDDREPTDSCDKWNLNPDVSAEEFS